MKIKKYDASEIKIVYSLLFLNKWKFYLNLGYLYNFLQNSQINPVN